MSEEFQESDVIFPDTAGGNMKDYQCNYPESQNGKMKIKKNNCKKKKKKKKKKNSTLPVNIPEIFSGNIEWFQYLESDLFEDEDEAIVPPHIILGRRVAGKVAFSVCTGNGRTLKGRDLSEVRNTILRMTGFLES